MTREEIKNEIKLRLPEYLSSKGINIRKTFRCFNPGHEDRNPSMSYDQKRNRVKCFSCNEKYDLIDLIGLDYGLSDYNDKLHKAAEIYQLDYPDFKYNSSKSSSFTGNGNEVANGIVQTKTTDMEINTPMAQEADTQDKQIQSVSSRRSAKSKSDKSPEELKAYFSLCHARVDQTDYFKARGISEKAIKNFNLGYDPSYTEKIPKCQAVIIPTSNLSYIARNTNQI